MYIQAPERTKKHAAHIRQKPAHFLAEKNAVPAFSALAGQAAAFCSSSYLFMLNLFPHPPRKRKILEQVWDEIC